MLASTLRFTAFRYTCTCMYMYMHNVNPVDINKIRVCSVCRDILNVVADILCVRVVST